jgi:hypothetical protein
VASISLDWDNPKKADAFAYGLGESKVNTVQQPAFSSPELQSALDKARESLEGADEARNQVSRDIKALESYLVGLRLTPPFRHSLGKTLVSDDDQSVAASLEYSGCASGKIEEDALILDEDAHGKLRLLYEISRRIGISNAPPVARNRP